MARNGDTVLELLRAETESCEFHELEAGTVALYAARRPGAARESEDSGLVLPMGKDLLLAVADGAGGHALGGLASATAIHALGDHVRQAGDLAPTTVEAGFDAAASAVRELGREAITTLLVATVVDGQVRTLHTGDSTALLVGQRGKRKLRTVDHTPPGLRAGTGEISFDDVHGHPERHLLVAALGIHPVEVEFSGPVPMARRDTLLLASDGLFDNLLDDQIVDGIRKGKLEQSLPDLVLRTRQRMRSFEGQRPGKPDDLFVMVFRPRG